MAGGRDNHIAVPPIAKSAITAGITARRQWKPSFFAGAGFGAVLATTPGWGARRGVTGFLPL
jgi:hypothetical protein